MNPIPIDASTLKLCEPNIYYGNQIIAGDIPDGVRIKVKSGSLKIIGDLGKNCVVKADFEFRGENIGAGSRVDAEKIRVHDVGMEAMLNAFGGNIMVKGDVASLTRLRTASCLFIDGSVAHDVVVEYQEKNFAYNKIKGVKKNFSWKDSDPLLAGEWDDSIYQGQKNEEAVSDTRPKNVVQPKHYGCGIEYRENEKRYYIPPNVVDDPNFLRLLADFQTKGAVTAWVNDDPNQGLYLSTGKNFGLIEMVEKAIEIYTAPFAKKGK